MPNNPSHPEEIPAIGTMVVVAGPLGAGKSSIKDRIRFSDNIPLVSIDHRCAWNEARQEKGRLLKTSDLLGVGDNLIAEVLRQLAKKPRLICVEMPLDTPQQLRCIETARNMGYFTKTYFVATESSQINFSRTREYYESIFENPQEILKNSDRGAKSNLVLTTRISQEVDVFDNSQ